MNAKKFGHMKDYYPNLKGKKHFLTNENKGKLMIKISGNSNEKQTVLYLMINIEDNVGNECEAKLRQELVLKTY